METLPQEQLARKTYDKYCRAVGGRAFNGDTLPTAEQFFTDPTEQKQADAWRADVEETHDLFLQCIQNLGHPAYNVSSSTTIAIDDLREKAFDYLGVPKA